MNLKNKLTEKRGEGYIDGAIIILICTMMIALAFAVYPVFVAKAQINQFASEIVREAEISGAIGTNVVSRIDKLSKELINVDSIEWDADYIQGTKKIQLNGYIEVTVEKTMNIGFFEFGSFPVKLIATDSGFSEVYWK